MNCSEIHEQIVLDSYGELADDQRHSLELHLAGCSACREDQEQFFALKTLAGAYPMMEPSPNLVARSRTRLADALNALPPKRWYDRLAEWMTRTATGLQSAPVAACLLLVAGAGLGSMGGYEFAERHAAAHALAEGLTTPTPIVNKTGVSENRGENQSQPLPLGPLSGEIANVSAIVRKPNTNLVEVTYNQVEPRRVTGSLDQPQIRHLLMMASQNSASAGLRDDSVALLAAECRAGHGCATAESGQGGEIRDALMVALRYDKSSTVRQKALEGLQPYVSEDMQVRNAVLEALLNDPEAKIRSEAIEMLQPVEADTSVRQVLSTVAASDQNPHIRTASRLVLRRVSDIQ